MKKIAILGSTGSIGVNALSIVREHRSKFKVVALAAGQNVDLLYRQMDEFSPEIVAVENETIADKLEAMCAVSSGPKIMYGIDGYKRVAAIDGVELVLSAMSGSVGLLPTIAAIEKGKVIALANKEIMVMAGNIICQKANASGSMILPVDSEHSAIFQCLLGHNQKDINKIILTASGGPFLNVPITALAKVTPSQALNHPRWNMGKKITIDSANLMNKGLEVIEARWLFNIDFENIKIHIHPQSIVHSLVEYIDGSVIAQLGMPDMKIPIAYALSFPERIPQVGLNLNLLSIGTLDFFPPDFEKFPNIRLAYEAGKIGGTMPTVLNAANEVAVKAFIDQKIGFTDITKIIENALSLHSMTNSDTIDDILIADKWARTMAEEVICRLSS